MFFLLIFCFILPLSCGFSYHNGSVFCKERKCTFIPNQIDQNGALAYGSYNDTLLEVGWGILDIVAGYGQTETSDDNIMFAAGFLEGLLTASKVAEHIVNIRDIFFKGARSQEIEAKLKIYFEKQDQWMRMMIQKNTPQDPFWRHIGYIVSQFDGLLKGYEAARYIKPILPLLTKYDFTMLNSNGDLLDLTHIVDPQSIPDWRKMTKTEAFRYFHRNGRCSALVKVLGAYEDILMSHSTWFNYGSTSRIYKHWNFNVKDEFTSAKKMSFSSYPGFLESIDDFYMLSSKMVMLQTTNSLFNTSLYKYCTPQSLLAWHRVRAANMMANSGKEWAEVFGRHNSGTYNNQYMIVDLKKIKLGNVIEDNALWVIEQIPDLVASGDVSPILRTGYWPSYNVPYFEDVYNKSGYPEFVAKHGLDASYQLAPRAKIFRRDEGTVKDLESLKHIMRYNDYKEDPYSDSNPCNTVCCRGDLEVSSPSTIGCYDTKVTDYKMALNLHADIINGPTLGTNLPPFKWTSEFNQSHVGLPSVYDFSFISARPIWSP